MTFLRVKFLLALFLIPVLFIPLNAEAGVIVKAATTFEYHHNLSNAEIDVDKRHDYVNSASISVGNYWQIADYTGVSAKLNLKGYLFHRYTGLNNTSFGVSVNLGHKLGLGRSATRLNFHGSVTKADYNDEFRDSWFYMAGANASRWVSNRINLQAGYLHDRRRADNVSKYGGHGDISQRVFDTSGHGGFLKMRAALTRDDLLTLSYHYRKGDVYAVSTPHINYKRAWSYDIVYGGLINGYRLDATTQTYSLGLSHALTKKLSLNLNYRLSRTSADIGKNYRDNLLLLGMAYSY